MKRIICLLLTFVLLFTFTFTVFADSNGNVNGKGKDKKDDKIYGLSDEMLRNALRERLRDGNDSDGFARYLLELLEEYFDFDFDWDIRDEDEDEGKKDVPSVIKYNRLLIPANAVKVVLGADVSWNAKSHVAIIKKAGTVIEINLATHFIKVNGSALDIRSIPEYKAKGTVVLFKFIARTLGYSWPAATPAPTPSPWVTPSPSPSVTPTPTPSATPYTLNYEAEQGTRWGGAEVSSYHQGYTGTGYVHGFWNPGAAERFTVNAPYAGEYNVVLRYANATAAQRSLTIYVNGSKVRKTVLPAGATWSTWLEKTEALTLNAGVNYVDFRFDNDDNGNVNLDSLKLQYQNYGIVSGSSSVVTGNVNLTNEGSLDWVHWGYGAVNGYNRKKDVDQRISYYALLGNASLGWRGDNTASYSWTDGVPNLQASGCYSNIFTGTVNSGFLISMPADTVQRTLKLYVGAWKAKGKVEAYIDDNSSPVYTQYVNAAGNDMVTSAVTINFRALSAGKRLIVKYTADTIHTTGGNISLQAAALR